METTGPGQGPGTEQGSGPKKTKTKKTETKIDTKISEQKQKPSGRDGRIYLILQKYDPDTLKLICHYNSFQQAILAGGGTENSYKKASHSKTIFNGFRWLILDKDADPAIEHEIGPTVSREDNLGNDRLVARINTDTHIIDKVFNSRNHAVEDSITIGHKISENGINRALAQGSAGKKFYYEYYDRCSLEQRETYSSTHELPELTRYSGKKVKRTKIENGEITRYKTITEASSSIKVAPKTIKNACNSETKIDVKGYNFEWDV